jgi:predicted transcriptional regulator
VLNNPHHPLMLKAGGDYFTFMDQVTATLTPHSLELIDLIREDSTPTNSKAPS